MTSRTLPDGFRRLAGCFLAAALVLASAAAAPAQADAPANDDAKQAEAAKLHAADGRIPVPLPVDPDTEAELAARKQRERAADAGAAPSTAPRAEVSARAGTATAIDTALPPYDWDALFDDRVTAADGLALALAAPTTPYRYGTRHLLAVALRNLTAERRVLDAVPACGALGRADGLEFHVVSDDGSERVVANPYSDSEGGHPHPPLTVEPQTTLVDGVELTRLVASSSELRAARTLHITAEIPALGLRSNAVTVELVP